MLCRPLKTCIHTVCVCVCADTQHRFIGQREKTLSRARLAFLPVIQHAHFVRTILSALTKKLSSRRGKKNLCETYVDTHRTHRHRSFLAIRFSFIKARSDLSTKPRLWISSCFFFKEMLDLSWVRLDSKVSRIVKFLLKLQEVRLISINRKSARILCSGSPRCPTACWRRQNSSQGKRRSLSIWEVI